MWIVTDRGFFSIVKERNGKSLIVRARARDDIENLIQDIKRITGIDSVVHELAGSDYRYRIFIHPDYVAEVMAHLITKELNYTNFKSRIDDTHPDRHDIYFDIWFNLRRLEALDTGDGKR